MAYIVQANVPGSDDAASISVGDRQDALAAALRWLSEGYTGVKIIGDARTYTPEELALMAKKNPPAGTGGLQPVEGSLNKFPLRARDRHSLLKRRHYSREWHCERGALG